MIQRYVYVFGVWEPDITAWVRQHVDAGSVVVDVGANVGYYTLLAAELVGPEGRVIAFECTPSISELLKANIQLNGCTNVDIHQIAASDKPGFIEVFRGSDHNIGNSSTAGDGPSEGRVQAVRLDDALREIDPSRISWIKVDVEGDELRVLRGAQQILAGLSPGAAVSVEVTPSMLERRGDHAEGIRDLLPDDAFAAYVIANDYVPARYESSMTAPVLWTGGTIDAQVDMLFIKR